MNTQTNGFPIIRPITGIVSSDGYTHRVTVQSGGSRSSIYCRSLAEAEAKQKATCPHYFANRICTNCSVTFADALIQASQTVGQRTSDWLKADPISEMELMGNPK